MANPESAAGNTIHTLRDRLQRAQGVKDYFKGSQSAAEKLFQVFSTTDTPFARSEIIASPEQTQKIINDSNSIRTWVIEHAATYAEEPSSRVDDEEGWAYTGEGFMMSADDTTKPSNLSTKFLLSIFEISPHDPFADLWFSVVECVGGNKYTLNIDFHQNDKIGQKKVYQSYISEEKSFREMPEDDATIIGDLLTRVSNHLAKLH